MADFKQVISSPTAAYDEALAFFQGRGMLNRTLLRIVADLEQNGIDYAVIGAIASINMGINDSPRISTS